MFVSLQIGLAQINTRVGDLKGNCARIEAAVRAAEEEGADLIVLPELCLVGFPPRDLLLSDRFVEASLSAAETLAKTLSDAPPTLIGMPQKAPLSLKTPGHPGLFNSMVLLSEGRIQWAAHKRLLPVYDVFHEPRWFVPGPAQYPLKLNGHSIGVCICEDLWSEGYAIDPPRELLNAGAEFLICCSASPFRAGVLEKRLYHAKRANSNLLYVNTAGAQDELIFDGGSFAMNAKGELVAELPRFEECVSVFNTADWSSHFSVLPPMEAPEELFKALVLGVSDFARKNGIQHLFLGLSGGVDSALVACIAAKALGPKHVSALALPSRFSDPRSTECARELAEHLGIGFSVHSIEPYFQAFEHSLPVLLPPAHGVPEDTTLENIQARIRATVLMAAVNRKRGLLLNTSNKTELSLGYGTLYGDMAGTLSVIGDLTKSDVYAVAHWVNEHVARIPAFILERPPSAELRENQVDPFDYARVSPLVEAEVLGTGAGLDAGDAEALRLHRLLRGGEHKRWQAGVVLKVSEKAFGSGRLMPITRADPLHFGKP